ncbi:MAG: TetR/AcrR family transcriptional regulator [Cypionkella sp.]
MSSQTKDTRSHILSVGRSLTARQGYAGVGLNELLKAADVPKGSFYHYFPSKEAYGCALLEDFVRQYREGLGDTLAHPTRNARECFLGYFEDWHRKQTSAAPQDRCLVVKLSAEVADLSVDMSHILQRGVTEIIARLAETLAQGVAEGSIAALDDPRGMAQAIYHQWLGASLVAGLSHSDAPLIAAMKATEAFVPAA